ncbi:MAG: RnfABCDGE type electron transport complex subunit D [Candidatus Aenigmarchaeota archaeon]|nr:RnfABCDGE type electron transport complex subunit D [Candidatus Aenigmarchaeota archaeon]
MDAPQPLQRKQGLLDKYNRINVYRQMILTLLLLAVINAYYNGVQVVVDSAIAAASAVFFHFAKSKLRKREGVEYDSVIISGLFIGLILSPAPLHALVFASFIAVMSHFVKINNHHLFNPAMSGIFLAALFLNAGDSWVGASQLVPVLILGLLVSHKFRRFHLTLPFLAAYLSLSMAHRLVSNAHPVYHDIFGGLVYFLAFFMLVEPKTTPITRNGRIAYGIISAIIIFSLSLAVPKYAAMAGLLVCNLLVQPIGKFVK